MQRRRALAQVEGSIVAVIDASELVKAFSHPQSEPGRFSGLRRAFSARRCIERTADGVRLDVQRGALVGY